MTAAIGWQVVGRYALNDTPAWTEQASLVLMIWFVMFAAAAGVHRGFHIRIGILVEIAPKPVRLVCRGIALGVIIACGIGLAVWGTELAVRTWSHDIPALGLPRTVAYVPLPISGALMVLFSIERLLELMAGHERERTEGSAD